MKIFGKVNDKRCLSCILPLLFTVALVSVKPIWLLAIGIEACRQGKRTLFINCHELLSRLRVAYEKGELDRSINRYARYELLIIDEIGYLPIDHDEANLLFQLINARYEQNSTIITSNTDLSGWVEIFQNPTVTAAILDRLVHHVHVVKITGKSYRLKGVG